MITHFARSSVVALVAAIAAVPAAAQTTLTPRALGMGGAYVAAARGNESLFLNPANLGLSGNPHWSIAFPQVSVGGSVLGPDMADLGDIANFDNVDDARLDEILNTIPEDGTEIRYDFRAPLVALQTGRFALGVSYASIGEHSMGRDLVELLFFGYEEGRTDYAVGHTQGSRATFWDFAAAFGHKIGPISFGATGHYIKGGTVLNSRLFEPNIDLEARDIEVNYRTVFARGGQGYGLDVGAAYQPVPSVTLSASVINAFAKMEWSEDLYTRGLTLRRGDFEDAEYMILENRYERSEERLDPTSAPLEVLETARGLYEQAYLPTMLNAGAAWQGSHGTLVSAGYRDQLTEGRLGYGWDRMASVGIQQKLPLITLRAGYASDLAEGSMISGGVTLGVLQFGFAKMDEIAASGDPRAGWVGTFGIGVRTTGELQ
jgi:hypothetical protein